MTALRPPPITLADTQAIGDDLLRRGLIEIGSYDTDGQPFYRLASKK